MQLELHVVSKAKEIFHVSTIQMGKGPSPVAEMKSITVLMVLVGCEVINARDE